jgi:integrase/recombinase XerC
MPGSDAPEHDPDMDNASDMINAYLEHIKYREGTEATVRARRDLLVRLHRELPYGLRRTCRAELVEWLHLEREKPWAHNTRANYFWAIKSAYEFWADPDDPWVSHDPTEGMHPIPFINGEAHPIEDKALWTILDRAAEPYRTWAVLAAYQGLRCIEVSRLDREHITEQKLFVVQGKGGRPRVHDTHELVWAAVRDFPRGPIARLERSGARASAGYISARAGRHFRRLGVDASMHALRHWLGCHAQALYRDIRVTQELLGHVSLSSTQIYTRATLDQQREARAMLPRPGAA